MQIYVCVICKVKKPPLYVLSVEHRQIFEAVVSAALDIAKLKTCHLLACVDCQRLIQTVQLFQQTALVRVRNLLKLMTAAQQAPYENRSISPGPDPLQICIKNEIEEPTIDDSHIKTELEPEQDDYFSEESIDLKQEFDAPVSPGPRTESPAVAHEEIKTPPPPKLVKLIKIDMLPHQHETPSELSMGLQPESNGLTAAGPRAESPASAPEGTKALPAPKVVKLVKINVLPHQLAALLQRPTKLPKLVPTPPKVEPKAVPVESRARQAQRWLETVRSRRREYHYHYQRPVKCERCPTMLYDGAALDKHVAKVHPPPPSKKCEECGKVFKNLYRLRKHSCRSGAVPLQLFCTECKMQFSSHASYCAHFNSLKHTNRDDWKFECDYCGKKCPSKAGVGMHIKIVHTKERNFKCPHCPRSFVGRGRLARHAERHAPGGPPRPHVCDQCGKAFMENGTLRQHMNIHNGLRPYSCKFCPATFAFTGAVYTHTKLKHLKIKKQWKKKERKKKEKKDSADNSVHDEAN